MATEFRVLGPLELRRDGASVALRARAQRRLLGILLLEQGSVVSTDRLAEALWPAAQPSSARHAMQMTVSRTRRLLGDAGELVARPPGYVLEIDPAALDAVRFERLLVEARDLVGSDPGRAAARAADALALWRGVAYEDFVFDAFATEESARLEELRLEAEEERVEAELALGRAAELVGDLEALVEAEPLRERRRAQLMLALYRSGRQADALATFRGARTLMLEELGIEPGPALRALEHAILNQDPALDAPGASALPPVVSRRPVSVLVVEPTIPLELDPEEHERRRSKAAAHVADVASHFGAMVLEPFVLAFVQEDHAERAAAAEAEVRGAIDARVGTASGVALVGDRAVGGPLVETARKRARARRDATLPAAATATAELPFVGRMRERARLESARFALLTGPPGIGKTRLARELAAAQPSVLVRCPPFGDASLAPLRELASLIGAPGALDAARADETPLLVRRACEAVAPILVVVDDVQWADPLVRETIEHLAAHATAGVRLLAVARDDAVDDRPELFPTAERVSLAPLDAEEALVLARDPEIAARAEGNPLFIEQLRAHAAETTTALPATLHALLAARFDRLTPTERAALQRAAVIGRDFDAVLVGPRAPLESLVRRSLLEPAPASEAYRERFRFAHALIRDAAYESIPRRERSALHEALADELAADGADDEVVGFHLERAAELRPEDDRHALRLAEDAGRALASAGIATWKRGNAAGAVALLQRANALRPDGDVACELAIALNTSGAHAEAADLLARIERTGDRRLAAWARLERAVAVSAEAAEILRHAEAAIPVFEALGDERGLSRAWLLAGWIRGGAFGRNADWLAAAERARAHYTAADFPPATCLAHIAAALYFGPTPVAAATDRCRELLAEIGTLAGAAGVSAHLGGLLAMAGEWQESATLLLQARRLYTDLGQTPSLTRTCAPLEARAARLAGDLDRAAAVYTASCEALVADGAAFHLATQAAELADVLAVLGRRAEAASWLAVAERHAQRDDLAGRIAVAVARARVTGRGAADAVALAEQTDNLNVQAQAYELAGNVTRATELYALKGNAVAAAAATAS